MSHKKVLLVLVFVSLSISSLNLGLVPSKKVVLAAVPSTQAGKKCTEATLQGAYGLLGSGFVMAGPIAQVGIVTFDGEGGLSIEDTISINGEITRRVRSGSYSVEPNCTGSLTIDGEVTITRDLVIVAGGSEAFSVQTNPGRTNTHVYKKL